MSPKFYIFRKNIKNPLNVIYSFNQFILNEFFGTFLK